MYLSAQALHFPVCSWLPIARFNSQNLIEGLPIFSFGYICTTIVKNSVAETNKKRKKKEEDNSKEDKRIRI
jgi:hypothetical protein